MLYPNNIKIKEKDKTQLIKEKLQELKSKIKYLISDRTNLSKKILIKLHF